jgi:hypothetical protein
VACAAEPASTSTIAAPSQVLKLNLNTAEARNSLQLAPVPYGKGSAVIIQNIVEGCEAWRAGVRQGHRLVAISDPINLIQVWPLDHMVSARFVRESLRMRNSVWIRLDFDTSVGAPRLRACLWPVLAVRPADVDFRLNTWLQPASGLCLPVLAVRPARCRSACDCRFRL